MKTHLRVLVLLTLTLSLSTHTLARVDNGFYLAGGTGFGSSALAHEPYYRPWLTIMQVLANIIVALEDDSDRDDKSFFWLTEKETNSLTMNLNAEAGFSIKNRFSLFARGDLQTHPFYGIGARAFFSEYFYVEGALGSLSPTNSPMSFSLGFLAQNASVALHTTKTNTQHTSALLVRYFVFL